MKRITRSEKDGHGLRSRDFDVCTWRLCALSRLGHDAQRAECLAGLRSGWPGTGSRHLAPHPQAAQTARLTAKRPRVQFLSLKGIIRSYFQDVRPAMPTLYNRIQGRNLERLAALSDGIFAVAMTLLV